MELINNCRYQGYDKLFNDEYIPFSMLQNFLCIVTSIFLIDIHLRTLELLSLIEHPYIGVLVYICDLMSL